MLKLRELINIDLIKRMAENIYAISGMSMGIVAEDGTVEVAVGWQDICTKYHRDHKITCKNCITSDKYIKKYINKNEHIAWKCLNNMWDIAIPIVISNIHIATIFLGQFFYDDEVIDIEYFRNQAQKFGFDEKGYLEALSKVPIFSREQVNNIVEYYKGFIMTLGESGIRQLKYKNAKKEIQKSQKYLNAILNSVNDAIFIKDFDGNILDVNQTATSMFGYSRDEFINMNIEDVISPNSSNKRLEKESLLSKLKKANPLIIEVIYVDKNNTEFWGEANIRIANIDEDERVIVTARNITERKKTELELKNETSRLEKLRTEFFANISHELRTPINIILGAIKINKMNLQKNNIEKDKIINNINIEKQNCLRLLRLVNNLIDATKLDENYIELNLANSNIVSAIEEIILSVAEYVNNNGLMITFDTDIEEKIMAFDLDKIERIMLNLLSNAIKFTRPGGNIFVNIYDGKEFITILIEDTGIGIPRDKLDVIFDRFKQVGKSLVRSHEGSGIGLSLVKSLVEMHGGKITVESKYEVGTKFCIRLPVRLIDNNNSEQAIKMFNSKLDNNAERIQVEFSDIY